MLTDQNVRPLSNAMLYIFITLLLVNGRSNNYTVPHTINNPLLKYLSPDRYFCKLCQSIPKGPYFGKLYLTILFATATSVSYITRSLLIRSPTTWRASRQSWSPISFNIHESRIILESGFRRVSTSQTNFQDSLPSRRIYYHRWIFTTIQWTIGGISPLSRTPGTFTRTSLRANTRTRRWEL